MKTRGVGWLLMAALLVLPGCSYSFGYTGLSTKNMNFKVPATAQRSTGKHCIASILTMFGVYPNVTEAADRAMEKAGPQYNALVDGVLEQVSYPFVLCFAVEGTPVIADEAFIQGHLGETGDRSQTHLHSRREIRAPFAAKSGGLSLG